MLAVPLNCMCSTQWDSPVLPGRSFRLPTRYQVQTETIGAEWSSRRMTPSPLFSCVVATSLLDGGAMAFALRSEIVAGMVFSRTEPASQIPRQDRMQPVKWPLEATHQCRGLHAARGEEWRRSIRSSGSTTGSWTASSDFCKREIAASFRSPQIFDEHQIDAFVRDLREGLSEVTHGGSARKTSATGFVTSDQALRRIIDEWGRANGDWPEGSFPQDPVTALGSSSPVDSPPARAYAKRVVREPKPSGE